MVAPPERHETGSAKAVQQYEKRREFTIGRVSRQRLLRSQEEFSVQAHDQSQPLTWVLQALATSLHKTADQLVLEHRGMRIFTPRLAATTLGLSDGDELRE
jgi:hypothetical protein